MEGQKSKKVIIGIFLFAVFIILALYLGSWITTIYKGSTHYTNQSTKTTVDCIGYVFRVQDVRYEGTALSFTFETQRYSDHAIEAIIVSNGPVQEEVNLGLLEQGRKARVSIPDIALAESFEVYVKGCEAYKEVIALP